jgi:hypothetical protein
MICPKCGHERTATDDPSIPDCECPACGINYVRYNLKLKNILPTNQYAPILNQDKKSLSAKAVAMVSLLILMAVLTGVVMANYVGEFWFFVFVFIVIGVASKIAEKNLKVKKTKEMESKLKSLPDFNPTQQLMGCDGRSGLGVDESRKKICLITNNETSVSQRIISYKDIFSVELFDCLIPLPILDESEGVPYFKR